MPLIVVVSNQYTYMIPIGAPVTKVDYGILCITDSLRVRYDAPSPFTLWQLNVLSILPANHSWRPLPASPDYPKLGNEDIQAYWEWFQLYNEHTSVN